MLIYLALFTVIIVFRLAQTRGIIYNSAGLVITDDEQRKKDRNFIIFAFLCIIVLTALRGTSVGPDTNNYLMHFRRVCRGAENKVDRRNFETGYRFFVWCISRVTHSARAFFTVCAAIINVPVALFIYKYSNNKLQSVILYIAVGSFTFQLTGIRQSIAAAFLIVSMIFAIKRKPILFVAAVIFASFFHRSALLFLPVYIIGSPWANKHSIFFLILGGTGLFAGSAIFDRLSMALEYDEYIGTMGVEDSGGWTYVTMMLLAIVLYFVVRDSEKKLTEQKENIDRFFLITLLFALVLYLMRYQVRVAERVSLYYREALIILLPNAIYRIKNPVLRFVVDFSCGALAIALFFYWIKGSDYIYTPFWA